MPPGTKDRPANDRQGRSVVLNWILSLLGDGVQFFDLGVKIPECGRQDPNLLLGLVPVLLFNGFPYPWQGLDPIARIKSGSVNLMFEPASTGQSLIQDQCLLQADEFLVEPGFFIFGQGIE